MFKFIHAADLHLDSPLRGLDEYAGCPSEQIRLASRKALQNLVYLAIEEEVRFVLIAGDIYDGEWKDHNTGLFFVRQMAALNDAGVNVVLIKGNHDAESKIPSHLKLPPNVIELPTNKPGSVRLEACGVAIHGQGFKTPKVVENLADAYPIGDRHLFNIGLLHTCAGGVEGHERYSPCSVDVMRSARFGYDYWALGHIHKREILHDLHPLIAFPGNLQGRHIRETGPKGCLLVEVDDSGTPHAEFRRLDVFRWDVCRVDTTGAEDADVVLERAEDLLRDVFERSERGPMAVRIELFGKTAAHRELSAKASDWLANLRGASLSLSQERIWIEKVVNQTSSPAVLGDDAMGALVELAQVIQELRSDPAEMRAFVNSELAELLKRLGRPLRDPAQFLGIETDAELLQLIESTEPLIQSVLQSA